MWKKGIIPLLYPPSPCGGIGRRGRLKICYRQRCGSSSLPEGTIAYAFRNCRPTTYISAESWRLDVGLKWATLTKDCFNSFKS